MKKALTIEDLKKRIGKPIFVASLIYGTSQNLKRCYIN